MVRLSRAQKSGLIVAGTALAVFLILGTAEGTFEGLLSQKSQPPTKFPPKGKTPAPKEKEPPVPQVELHARAPQTIIVMSEECDPLGDYPYPFLCFDTPDGWRLKPALNRYPNDSTIPPFKADQIAVSNDFSDGRIGSTWIFRKLHPFLNKLREDGVLAVVADEDDFDLTDVIFNDPASFINETLGTEHAGGVILLSLYIIASGGLSTGPVLSAAPWLAAPIAAGGTVSTALSAAATGGGLVGELLLLELITDPFFEGLQSFGKVILDIENPEVAASALEAFGRVIDHFQVVHGTEGYMYLREVPYNGFPAMEKIMADILRAIVDFQARKFTWDENGGPGTHFWPMP